MAGRSAFLHLLAVVFYFNTYRQSSGMWNTTTGNGLCEYMSIRGARASHVLMFIKTNCMLLNILPLSLPQLSHTQVDDDLRSVSCKLCLLFLLLQSGFSLSTQI